ncbi:unnamed protein product, partial [marine sediment metagenome]
MRTYKVVSEDGMNTVTYFLTFLNELNPDANIAPEVEVEFSDTSLISGTIMLKATASDDGLPPPAALTYMWEVTTGTAEDVTIENANALETNATFNVTGNYVLTLSVSDGSLTTQVTVTVSVATAVGEVLKPAMRIYPNPATEKLTLELVNMTGRSSMLSIYDITGSMVYSRELTAEITEIDINDFEA